MENITIAPQEVRKSFITEMKRETKPSRRLRMHIILLASEGRSPTEISRVLFCSRTTVYAVVGRFAGEGRVAFDDRKRRGPEPLLRKNQRLADSRRCRSRGLPSGFAIDSGNAIRHHR